MPLTYRQFVENRNRNPEEFNRNILPQMDLLEAALRETVRTLNNAQPKDAARIKEFNAMADAIHTVCHPGTLTWESTKNAAMQRFGTLRDFLEKEDGKNYELLEATMKEHTELLANLPQAEQSKPMMERYRDLSVYFGLNYSADYTRRFNKLHRERFLANRDKDPTGFRNYTAKQIDYVSAVFRQLAQELEDERGDYRQIRALRQMAEHLTVLKADGDKVSAQEMENALEKLRGLSALLEDHEGELALRLHSAAGKNPKLLELLPDSPALRKMPVLQHLTEIIPVLSLELTNGLQQLAAQENMLVTEEQEQLAQQQEEAARLADLQAEEEDAQEELRQNLAQGLNQGPQPVNQPSGKRVVVQGNPLHGKLRDTLEEISANPALKGAAVDVIMPDQVPGPASDHVEEQILPPHRPQRDAFRLLVDQEASQRGEPLQAESRMAEINRGLAFNPKYKVDAALAMAIYKENAQNPDAQLDDTKALRTAAALRKLPFYKEFQGREETNDKLKQNIDIGGLYNDYVQLKEQHQQDNKEQDARPLNELLDEREPQRSSTLDSVLNWK